MKISIITPTYNRADLIDRAILSILNQTYQNFELIIVDDASEDNTTEVVSKYLHDGRIKFVRLPVNSGVNIARNKGIQNISNDVDAITFLDSDDEFYLNALQNIIEDLVANPGVNYFRFRAIYNEDDKHLIGHERYVGIWNYNKLLTVIDADFGDWATVLRKEVIDNGFYFEEGLNAFEVISWFRLLKQYDVFFSIKTVLKINLQINSLSTKLRSVESVRNTIKGLTLLLTENEEQLKRENKNYYAVNMYALGNSFFGIKDFRNGIHFTLKAIKCSPLDLRIFRNLATFITHII